ncbi:hypothetical protein Glove_267g66 [Diversispora epigaea]|uniref:Uncharacterized protein n=1 Tax=Diversispora epigaea TaxID=1348612 RepID=A0A397I5B5_9GLOM|nr:hypothetical protein Glove_267g66 [Diversispora epigaea]
MLSQLFLISTLLLVGIMTVVIGLPVEKTIDHIEFETLQMESASTKLRFGLRTSPMFSPTNDVGYNLRGFNRWRRSPIRLCVHNENIRRWSNDHNDCLVCTNEFVINNANGFIMMGMTMSAIRFRLTEWSGTKGNHLRNIILPTTSPRSRNTIVVKN